jgi:hypothetical protein
VRSDGGAAEFGGDREQVVDAWCLVVLAAFDVAAYEGAIARSCSVSSACYSGLG